MVCVKGQWYPQNQMPGLKIDISYQQQWNYHGEYNHESSRWPAIQFSSLSKSLHPALYPLPFFLHVALWISLRIASSHDFPRLLPTPPLRSPTPWESRIEEQRRCGHLGLPSHLTSFLQLKLRLGTTAWSCGGWCPFGRGAPAVPLKREGPSPGLASPEDGRFGARGTIFGPKTCHRCSQINQIWGKLAPKINACFGRLRIWFSRIGTAKNHWFPSSNPIWTHEVGRFCPFIPRCVIQWLATWPPRIWWCYCGPWRRWRLWGSDLGFQWKLHGRWSVLSCIFWTYP